MQDTGGATALLNPESHILVPEAPHSLFISDLHLSADHPHSKAAFDKFIATEADHAEALYVLGDLFEYWAGDDDLHDPFHQHVINSFRSLTATRVFLMHGNRDLLMGEALAHACNATLLSDPTLIDLYGTPTLISHGDALCTDDLEYQRFRELVHSIDFKIDFLAKSLSERKAYIEQLRRHSETEKKTKNMSIMDVNSEAVATLLREFHFPRLVHGHTHRTARHEHHLDGHLCERWVLSDWDSQISALRCDNDGIRFQYLT